MITFHRVAAMVRRHLMLYTRDLDKINSFFYWPLTMILTFGLITYASTNGDPDRVAHTLLSLSVWQVMLRVSFEVAKLVLAELFSHNIVNLLATPLTFAEWVVTGIIMAIATSGIVAFSCAMWSYLFFNVALWQAGPMLAPILFFMPFLGLIFGFFIAGLFMLWGLRAIDLMYTIVWVVAPVSGAYGPLSVLPLWLQKIAWLLPYAYLLESLRTYQQTSVIPWYTLACGVPVTFLYVALGIGFFRWAFCKSKQLGIARLG